MFGGSWEFCIAQAFWKPLSPFTNAQALNILKAEKFEGFYKLRRPLNILKAEEFYKLWQINPIVWMTRSLQNKREISNADSNHLTKCEKFLVKRIPKDDAS